MLERLGLDSSVGAVYEQLITGPHQGTTNHLAERLGLSEKEVRQALERLAELDLIRLTDDGPGPLTDPRLGLKSLLLRQMSGIEAQLRAFEEDRTTVMALIDKYAHGRPGDTAAGSEYVTGESAVAARLREFADSADDEWLAFVPGGAPSASWLRAVRPLERGMRRRGVTTRTVSTDSVRGEATVREGEAGQPAPEVRTVPSLPVPMLIVDGARALLPTDPADPWHGALQVSARGALDALTALFESVWESAVPLRTATPEPDEHGLTQRERELLRLLARGLNDDAIRRRLGVSLRTVRRGVADLCTRLGAGSRFEAGYLAAKRGWI